MAIPKEFNIPMFGCEQGLATPFLFVDDAPTNHWIVGISKKPMNKELWQRLRSATRLILKKASDPEGRDSGSVR